MPDQPEHYRELLIDHSQRPRHQRALTGPGIRRVEAQNPLCNDRVQVFLRIADETLEEISFTSSACAICTASASLMAERLSHVSVDEARRVYATLHAQLMDRQPPERAAPLGDVAAIADIKRFPLRIKCAMLPWHAMHRALSPESAGDDASGDVSTEARHHPSPP